MRPAESKSSPGSDVSSLGWLPCCFASCDKLFETKEGCSGKGHFSAIKYECE